MDQFEFFRRVIDILESSKLTYMVVGSFASGFWGESRATHDVDVVVALSLSDLPKLPALFPFEEFYFSPEAARQAIHTRTQFNVIHPDSGNKIDIVVLDYAPQSVEAIKRRRECRFDETFRAFLASPEDVILGKLRFYQQGGSEKHLRDIAGILKLQQQAIDLPYLDDRTTQMGTSQEWHLVRPH